MKLHDSEIDFERAEVLKNGEHISLTAKEHDILLLYIGTQGELLRLTLCVKRLGVIILSAMKIR